MTKAAIAPTEPDVIAVMKAENLALKELVEQEQTRIDWFRRRLFGETSEKRILPEGQTQENLLALLGKEMPVAPAPEMETITYERKKPGKSRDNAVNDSGLRFDDTVPLETIHLSLPPEAEANTEDRCEMVGEKETWSLAQHPANYVILRYIRPVIKEKPVPVNREEWESVRLMTVPTPANVLECSSVDVNFLAGMLVDKFLYHLPLYHKHQRLVHHGVMLAGSTLKVQHRSPTSITWPCFSTGCWRWTRRRSRSIGKPRAKFAMDSRGPSTMKTTRWFTGTRTAGSAPMCRKFWGIGTSAQCYDSELSGDQQTAGHRPLQYLMDVLQRVGEHQTKDVIELTLSLWKEKFDANPMKSDLELDKNASIRPIAMQLRRIIWFHP